MGIIIDKDYVLDPTCKIERGHGDMGFRGSDHIYEKAKQVGYSLLPAAAQHISPLLTLAHPHSSKIKNSPK